MSNQDERTTGQAEVNAPLAAPVETKDTDKASEKAEIVSVENPAAPAAIKETDKGHWGRGHTFGFFAIIVAIILTFYVGITRNIGALGLWVFIGALILASMIIAGHGIIGYKSGLLIDDRNRFSLSRLQIILWTTLILSAFFASVMINLNTAFKPSPANATMVMNAATIAIPQEIWILMGITATSLVGSPLILSMSKEKTATLSEDDKTKIAQRNDVIKAQKALQKEGRASSDIKKFVEDQVDGQLIVNKDPKYAGWSDMFKGEYTNDAAQLDLGKVQMMYFTIIVLVVYAAALLSLLSSANEIHKFPNLSEGMVALIAISNGGYLLTKAVSPNKPT